MKITHLKKIKPGFPPIWLPVNSRKEFSVYFIPRESSKYIQSNSNEQKDWLKSLGLSYSPIFNSHKNSVMLGWRYNPTTDLFEFGPYWHDSIKEAHYPEKVEGPIISARVNEPIKCLIKEAFGGLQEVEITNLISKRRYTYLVDVKRSKWARTISPWFGGTLPPPKSVCYDLYWNITDEEALLSI